MTFETTLTPKLIEKYTSEGFWTNRTITDFLDEAAARTPDKVAFIDSRREITYAALKREVDQAALGLVGLGVGSGDVVSFQIPNWIEWIVVHYAASRIGAISNPLIPIYREREVGFMVGLAKSRVIVVPSSFRGFDYPAMVEKIRPEWPSLEHVIVIDGKPGEGAASWEEFMASAADDVDSVAALDARRPDPNDVTLLIFTSGTTGEPKGVMHSHNTVIAANNPLPERLGITQDTVFHMASTLAHLTGFLYGGRLSVQNGATCVLQDVWDAETFLELVERHHIGYTSAATPFLHDVLSAKGLEGRDVSSLVRFCCMGAPIPRVLVREAKDKMPDLVVLGGWGQTEEGLVTLGIPGDPEDKIIDTDGYPWPGMSVRAVDVAGVERPADEEGRLQVKGPFLFVGYAERPEMTEAQYEGDWFDTGDLAKIDVDGYVRISGRTKDVIIRGGENIPVSYVENALYENEKIDGVAVVGIPDPRLQERACACVILKPEHDSFTFAEMQEFLADKGVAKQYWPEKLVVLADFPKTPSGKIQKFQLRDQVKGDL